MNLGDKIKKIKIDIQNKETEKLRREEAARLRKIVEEQAKIEGIFTKAWDSMLADIELEELPKGVVVQSNEPFTHYSSGSGWAPGTPENFSHPYHGIYLRWVELAQKAGLNLYITDEHDGCGVKSWYRVTFTV